MSLSKLAAGQGLGLSFDTRPGAAWAPLTVWTL